MTPICVQHRVDTSRIVRKGGIQRIFLQCNVSSDPPFESSITPSHCRACKTVLNSLVTSAFSFTSSFGGSCSSELIGEQRAPLATYQQVGMTRSRQRLYRFAHGLYQALPLYILTVYTHHLQVDIPTDVPISCRPISIALC